MALVHVLPHLEAPFPQEVYQVACGLACRARILRLLLLPCRLGSCFAFCLSVMARTCSEAGPRLISSLSALSTALLSGTPACPGIQWMVIVPLGAEGVDKLDDFLDDILGC